MKRIIFAFMAMFMLSSAVFAEQFVISVDGKLTDKQKAELQIVAAEKIAQDPVKTTQVVKEWVDIGTAIGSGLASSAKELGVAANDFAKTPVGEFTVFMIAWHFIGQDLIGITFGFTWLLFTIPTWIYLYRRLQFNTETTTYETGKGPNGVKKVVTRRSNSLSDAEGTLYWISLMAIIAIGVSPIVF